MTLASGTTAETIACPGCGLEEPDQHAAKVRAWAAEVWETWRPHHDTARALADRPERVTGRMRA